MPYLNEAHKAEIERVLELDRIAEYIATKNTNDFAGAINYLNFVIIKKRTKVEGGACRRYFQFAMWVGTMICCVLEVYRRLIGPYEDEAIEKNGDVE